MKIILNMLIINRKLKKLKLNLLLIFNFFKKLIQITFNIIILINLMTMVRYEKDGNYWEIVHILNIDEIIERTGKIGTLGKFNISIDFEENKELEIIKCKIDEKLNDKWKSAKLSISEKKLIDIRFEFYDLNGNFKYTKN